MTGNLTADPVISEREWTNKETGEIIKAKVCNFTVAANDGFGESRKTAYFKVHAWRGLADTCYKCLKKGRGVWLEGPVTLNNYIGTDNQLHSSMEVRVDQIEFLGKGVESPKEEEPGEMIY
jgi:single-stranded DNA-binding protein